MVELNANVQLQKGETINSCWFCRSLWRFADRV